MQSLKVGLLGSGGNNVGDARGLHHARHLAALDAGEIVAVCDIVPEAAERAAAQLNATAYTDYDKFLRHGLDLVIIATPDTLHAQQAARALEAGVGVVSEVPAATTLEDAAGSGACLPQVRRLLHAAGELRLSRRERTDPAYVPGRQVWRRLLRRGRISPRLPRPQPLPRRLADLARQIILRLRLHLAQPAPHALHPRRPSCAHFSHGDRQAGSLRSRHRHPRQRGLAGRNGEGAAAQNPGRYRLAPSAPDGLLRAAGHTRGSSKARAASATRRASGWRSWSRATGRASPDRA